MNDLPTFIVIGAMKAGTTTLYEHLARHPDVFMSTTKELDYFTGRDRWRLGPDWYRAQFRGTDATARGEATPAYSQADIFPGVAERMVDLLPDVRLIYLVRHPIARLRSMYLHQLANGREREPIDVAVRRRDHYVNASRYAWQLSHYEGLVPAERIKVIRTERMLADTTGALEEVFSFVGVDPARAPTTHVHRGRTEDKRTPTGVRRAAASLPGYDRVVSHVPEPLRRRARRATTRPIDTSVADIDEELEQELRARLAPDVEDLRRWLGDEVEAWGLSA